MRKLNLKYAAASNFLPFGPDGIELHFNNYKNIVLIRGENRDAKHADFNHVVSEENKISSNGSGKSTILDIVCYGLYGKTVKRPEKLNANDVVNNKIGKNCRVEIIFDDYRIVRTRLDDGRKDKNTLRLWQSADSIWDKNTELTQGTMQTTQKKIEDILGLSCEAFVNIAIFTDDQRSCFLECDTKQKKEIVENLLSLGNYREWHEKAKELRKSVKSQIDLKAKEYSLLLGNKDDAKRRLELTKKKDSDWKIIKQQEISNLEKTITVKKTKLSNTDSGSALLAYQQAQQKIKSINESLPTLETQKDDLSSKLSLAKDKETSLKQEAQKIVQLHDDNSRQLKSKVADRKKREDEIKDLQSNTPGTHCSKCRSVIEEGNIEAYINDLQKEIIDINLDIKALMTTASDIAKQSEDLKIRQNKVSAFIQQFNNQIGKLDSEMRSLRSELVSASQVREPKADSDELLLEQEIKTLQEQLQSKNNELSGKSPYQDIIDNDEVELDKIGQNCESKSVEIKDLEAELPYYDYWISGFGDHGIRKWVVDGIIPELNNRINYWLQFLNDNKITLKFDNELNETIERNPVDGDPYVYHAMSTGQRRRINLAVSQAFAHIMSLSSGSVPSVVFLDEISTNVDPLGVQGIYNMICELAEDKQVFVTTHDQDLLRMLQGCDIIQLVHENGFTSLVS